MSSLIPTTTGDLAMILWLAYFVRKLFVAIYEAGYSDGKAKKK